MAIGQHSNNNAYPPSSRSSRREASTWVIGAALCALFGCTVCGSDTPPVAAAPGKLTTSDEASPCGDEATLSSRAQCVPNAWFCGPRFYSGGQADGCDCDCGVPDPDCSLGDVKSWCYNLGRPRQVNTCSACSGAQLSDALD